MQPSRDSTASANDAYRLFTSHDYADAGNPYIGGPPALPKPADTKATASSNADLVAAFDRFTATLRNVKVVLDDQLVGSIILNNAFGTNPNIRSGADYTAVPVQP